MEPYIYKESIPSNDVRLKRHIYHDSRSRDFAFDTTGLEIVDVEHKRLCPIFNQGQVGSCTGNAGIGCINTEPFVPDHSIYTADEYGAIRLYREAEIIDGGAGYPPEDNGSSGLSIAKALLNSKMISGFQHTFTLNDALKALTQYPIMVGINWYSNMFNPDADGRVHPSGTIDGGHEIEGYKIDTKNGRIWFHNSWDTNWGIDGDFYLTWADFNTLLSQQGDVTVLIPPIITPPIPAPRWKYFIPGEFTNSEHTHTVAELNPVLVDMLDKSRGLAGVPFVITSGFRTQVEDDAIPGSAKNSAHIRGLAADIACTDSNRQIILNAVYNCGVKVFTEDCPSHIHIDIDGSIHTLGTGIVSQNG